MPRLSFTTKISLVLSLCFACLMGALSCGAILFQKSLIKSSVGEAQTLLLTELAAALDREMRSARALIDGAALHLAPALRENAVPAQALLEGRRELLVVFDAGLSLISTRGEPIAAVNPTGEGPTTFPWSLASLPSALWDQPEASAPFFSGAGRQRRLLMALSTPVRDQSGKKVALLVGKLDLSDGPLFGRLKQIRLGKNGYLAVVGGDRTVIVHPEKGRILTRLAAGANPLMERALQGYRGTGEHTGSDGGRAISTFVRLSSLPWYLAADLPVAEAYAPARQLERYLLAATLAAALICLLLAQSFLARSMKPLRELTGQVNRFSAGEELSSVQVVGTGAGDEIETLAHAFSSMATEIERRRNRGYEQVGFLQELLDAIPTPVFYKDTGGRYLGCNKAFESAVGIGRDQLIGKTCYDLTPKSLADQFFERDLALLSQQEDAQVLEGTVNNADGLPHEVLFYKAAFSGPEGGVAGIIGTVIDITERKQAERALKASEERYRVLFETTGAATVIAEEDATITLVNRQAAQLFGYRKEEVEGVRKWTEFIHPDDLARFLDHRRWWRLDPESIPQSYEVRAVNSSGAILNLYGKVAFIPGTNQSVSSHFDITELKKTQEALVRERLLLRCLVDSIPDLIFYKDVDGVNLGCNRAFEQFIGQSEKEIVGRNDYDLFPLEEAEFFRTQDRLMLERQAPRSNHEWGVYPDGSRRLFDTLKTPFLGPDGSIVGLIGVSRDITLQEEAARALRESEERFRKIFEQNEDAILLTRLNGEEIIDANSRAEALFGYRHEELIRLPVASLLAAEEAPSLVRFLSEMRGEGGCAEVRLVSARKDGERIFLALRGKTISLRDEKVLYCSFRDITDKIRMEQEVREFQSKLIIGNKLASLGLLVSGIVHEINNPNNFICVNSSMLSRIWGDTQPLLERYYELDGEFMLGGMPFSRARQEVPRLIEGVHKGSKRIQSIIENLKGMVKNDNRNLRDRVDLNRVIHDALAVIGHEVYRCTNAFSLCLAAGLPPVKGNHQQIEQVVINLMVNALQALPHKGCGITLSSGYDPEAGSVSITVADEGRGIPEKLLARVTEPFFSTRLDQGGTGLGLSISASIVKDHGGVLRIAPRAEGGTLVTVAFPPYHGDRFEAAPPNPQEQR